MTTFSSIDLNSNAILTNYQMKNIANKIIAKPRLISKSELKIIGKDIKLVGYDPIYDITSISNKTFSPKLLNWVEPYKINGYIKTLFYTEVNSELKVGDRVFIVNGNYDNDILIQSNKYKKGRDGYKVLFIDKCKIVLDIDYTGVLPYITSIDDDFIKVHYIRNQSEFLQSNRSTTTRGGQFSYKFDFWQNNIAFIDQNYSVINNWGGSNVSSTPGFYVRGTTGSWIPITTEFISSGSYSLALSPTYSNINRIKIFNDNFNYNGQEFKKGYIYEWYEGPTNSYWRPDIKYFEPYVSKNNFRDGTFLGEWNCGIFGQNLKKPTWDGDGSTWNIGTLINTLWKKGTINSLYSSQQCYFASFNEYGMPYQKINSPNNAGRGFNFIINSDLETSEINNGSFYNSKLSTVGSTYSGVENELISDNSPWKNIVNKAYFYNCGINNSWIKNSELKKIYANNSKFEKTKSINSYFNNSVFKNSIYNSDNIIKILAYQETEAAEYNTAPIAPRQKVYKFYIDKDSYDRLKNSDTFYIKGLKINDNSKNVINFFDKKFKITSWTEYTEENYTTNILGKRGYDYSAFLSTPLDNSYNFNAVLSSTYQTIITGTNSNSDYYSVDIWTSIYDISDTATNTNPNFTLIIDISNAYIIDSDFDSGLFQYSDWNSGHHIENNNDDNITIPSLSGGLYNLSIDSSSYITSTTSYRSDFPEFGPISDGNVVFIDSTDFNWGTISRIPDAYRVISHIVSPNSSEYKLQEIGTQSQILGLSSSSGYFYTYGAENRYGHLKRLKIDKSNIKSGFFCRSYITESLLQNSDYDYLDKDFNNLTKIKNLVISDSIFSNNGNKLSSATYLNSFFLLGNDTWNSGIIKDSIWNGGTFSNGVIRDSRWIDGVFTNAWFYNSQTFNAIPSSLNPYYYSENIYSYYKNGDASSSPNNRNSWQNGNFINGNFYKSDWESGTFSNGQFYHSKFYNGIIQNGIIGSNQVSSENTIIYNGTISYAQVENARFYAEDTSLTQSVNQQVTWQDGIFLNGVFGSNNSQTASNSITWENGTFNGGQFTGNAKWKNGTFNSGNFTSEYGYTYSISWTQSSDDINNYGWENGTFNGGEFGNANGLTNSTWYTGQFNGGVFKGRIWNNGIFLYGEFQGSGTESVVAGLTCANAQRLIDSYSYSYWGHWKSGIFTNIKDKFIKNTKIWTTPIKAKTLENLVSPKISKFKNGLWQSGTFSHPNGEMISSVWLDGVFQSGIFKSSSFNPYVIRENGTQSFNLNDETCYWENGELNDSDFYISHWKNGKFIIGTATGMIWENGVNDYMNAFNIFWENGLWRNGNWQGSPFELESDGSINNDYIKQIIYRGMSWSGTASSHIWNIFLDTTDIETNILDEPASDIT